MRRQVLVGGVVRFDSRPAASSGCSRWREVRIAAATRRPWRGPERPGRRKVCVRSWLPFNHIADLWGLTFHLDVDLLRSRRIASSVAHGLPVGRALSVLRNLPSHSGPVDVDFLCLLDLLGLHICGILLLVEPEVGQEAAAPFFFTHRRQHLGYVSDEQLRRSLYPLWFLRPLLLLFALVLLRAASGCAVAWFREVLLQVLQLGSHRYQRRHKPSPV
mmetsp:Transcript_98346/g.278119  ORF Transcript_98346/g.278119 Transcript_98346/m.278119 type:complete len:217 (-) Transcript_98346:44-694(-)